MKVTWRWGEVSLSAGFVPVVSQASLLCRGDESGWLDFWFVSHAQQWLPAGDELFCPLVNRWPHVGCPNYRGTRNCNIKLSKDPSALSSCPGICLSGCWKPQYNPSLRHRTFSFSPFCFCGCKPGVSATCCLFFISSLLSICMWGV